MVTLKTYTLGNTPLNHELLSNYINNFWCDIFDKNKDNHLMIMCKIKFTDTDQGYKTLGHLVIANYKDKDLYTDYLSERLVTVNDSYVALPICQITFSYVIKKGLNENDNRVLIRGDIKGKDISVHNFNNMNLPISMNPSDYGIIKLQNTVVENNVKFERFLVINGNKTFMIDEYEGGIINKVQMLGNVKLSWIDTKLEGIEVDYFKREIKKSTIYFFGGEIILRKKEISCKAFSQLQKDNQLTNDFYTFDIETVEKNTKLVPHTICAYNGRQEVKVFNPTNVSELFNTFMVKLISQLDYGTTKIYAHNLSTFDGVLILKHLFKLGTVEPILFNGRIISITLKIQGKTKNENKILEFKDSYLLLPSALRQLGIAFNVPVSKTHFPFKLNNTHYSGVFPKFEYWTGITQTEWQELKNKHGVTMWNYELESIKYCMLDCISLHQILTKFNELSFNEFGLNIHDCLTIPALAMKIFRSSFMPKDTIYQLLGNPNRNMRNSYTGGAVDVYIPHNKVTEYNKITKNNKVIRLLVKNQKGLYKVLYYYDVNSLYPYVMAYNDMPIGKPVEFLGDIRKVDSKAFGIFKVKITSPDNLDHPILHRRVKTKFGVRTIAGLGTWEGWIFSEEMYNAEKYGYKFEILNGYEFQRGNVFKDYIERLYKLRLEYPKTHPMNYIAKLLMNSLPLCEGKFGMKLETTEVHVFDLSNEYGQESFKELFELWAESIVEHIRIDNHAILVRNTLLSYKYNEAEDMFHGININVAIASAVTSYARVHMSLFKNNSKFKLYYSDTDSIIIDSPLPIELVGNNLGQVKLEHIIKRGIFLAPKVYGLMDEDGTITIKIKGVKHEVTDNLDLDLLDDLLVKDSSMEFKQFKWFKKRLAGEISIKDSIYNLKVTSNKRAHIYETNNYGQEVFTYTQPYNYNKLDDIISPATQALL